MSATLILNVFCHHGCSPNHRTLRSVRDLDPRPRAPVTNRWHMSEAAMSETVEADERPEGGSAPKRVRKNPSLPKDAALAAELPPDVPPARPLDDEQPALPKKTAIQVQGYCLGCGDTSCDRFGSASAGFKVAVVLILGEKLSTSTSMLLCAGRVNAPAGPNLSKRAKH